MLKNRTGSFIGALLISLLAHNAYSLEFSPGLNFEVMLKPNIVEVKLKASSFKPGKITCFEYDPEAIFDVKAQDTEYKDLKVTRERASICITPVSDKFFMTYKSKISAYKGLSDTNAKLPNIRIGKAILVFGNRIFLKPVFPKDVRISPAVYVKFSTQDLDHFMSSLNADRKKIEIKDMEKLMSSVILAGEMREADTRIEKKKYYFSFIGDWSKDNRSKISDVYKAVAQRQFSIWGFMPVDFMTITFIKAKNVKQGAGFEYNNAIVYILPENINIKDTEFLKLLAHEHLHIWNGAYFKPSENMQEELEWFHEGVTNYYSLMTLLGSGVISEKEFLAYLSKTYLNYDSSYKPTGEDSMENLRGFFIAMAMDIETIRASGLKANLDTVMKNISLKNYILHNGYDNKVIMTELMRVSNWDISDFFGRYIYSKKKLSMDPYFAYLGLKFSPALLLTKDRETKQYSKWITR
ncbi:MAG: hypothetical protein WCQ53_05480 [bacterium]